MGNTVRAGFTLVELILLVAVFAIIYSIMIPGIGWGSLRKFQAGTSGHQFSGYMKLARGIVTARVAGKVIYE